MTTAAPNTSHEPDSLDPLDLPAQENLTQRTPAGGSLKPWIALGPLYEDLSDSVQGLTLF